LCWLYENSGRKAKPIEPKLPALKTVAMAHNPFSSISWKQVEERLKMLKLEN
jgi:hypothetical protein